MGRLPFQVLVIPFRRNGRRTEYCVFRRSIEGYWQWIAGGGEDDDTPAQAARREAYEEAGIPLDAPMYRLQSTACVPVINFSARPAWPQDLYVVPEYVYAVDCSGIEVQLSNEHSACRWLPYDQAFDILHWQSNQTALWELDRRLADDRMPEQVE